MTKTDDNCIFCKIIKGEIPSNKIYDDEDFMVMLDISPASKGHAVLLPKYHAENLFELPDEYKEKALKVAGKCAAAIKKTLNCDGINILQNNGEAAGQTVFHFHIHIIPRMSGDNLGITWVQKTAEDNEKLAEEIKSNM
ncbi:MAG: HIT family protein [Lachnospiraceae bacterium]|nr:HIT family protein [Lachnospiraceae bacterium]